MRGGDPNWSSASNTVVHQPRHLIGLSAGLLLLASVIGLATRDDGGPAGPTKPGAVTIASFSFAPADVSLRVGGSVTWTNTDATGHTVNSSGQGPLDSGSIGKGKVFTQTFDSAGTYAYFCAFHPFMKGTIEVTK